MKTTNILLGIIAILLFGILIRDSGFIQKSYAQAPFRSGTVDVNIVSVDGDRIIRTISPNGTYVKYIPVKVVNAQELK